MDHWMDDFAGSVFTCAHVHIVVCVSSEHP